MAKRKGNIARPIPGYVTVNDIKTRLGLSTTKSILKDIHSNRLEAFRRPKDRGLDNAPFYVREEDAKQYIQEEQSLEPVGTE